MIFGQNGQITHMHRDRNVKGETVYFVSPIEKKIKFLRMVLWCNGLRVGTKT